MIKTTDMQIHLNDLRSIKKIKYILDIIFFCWYLFLNQFMKCKFMKDN